MINSWLKQQTRDPNGYAFNVVDLTEIDICNDQVKSFLGSKLLEAYRGIDFFKKNFKEESPEILKQYLLNNVFPSLEQETNIIDKNTKQGDFGEILSSQIIKDLRGLEIPLCKFRWKFNNRKSVLGTDIFAHNKGGPITSLNYYEVKTRITKDLQVGIDAHNRLEQDIPTESIADFLFKQSYYIAESFENEGKNEEAEKYYLQAKKYEDIVLHPESYSKAYELVLIIEKSEYSESILEKLNSLPPRIRGLSVTVFLVENFKNLVEDSFQKSISICEKEVYG